MIDYCAAAAAHPGAPDLKAQAETMQRRLDAGAEFFQTQIVFDIDQLKRFADSIPESLARKTLPSASEPACGSLIRNDHAAIPLANPV